MNGITNPFTKPERLADLESMTLEDLLAWLQQFGKPRLADFGGDWRCCIEMYVSSKGSKFEIASEFGHASPRAAAIECAQRVRQTMADLGRGGAS